MVIRIAAKGFGLTAGLIDYIHTRVRRRFKRMGGRAREIAITLSDVNGPRGGADKRCRVSLEIPGYPQLVAQTVHGDMYAAIDQSLVRAQQRLVRTHRRKLDGVGGL